MSDAPSAQRDRGYRDAEKRPAAPPDPIDELFAPSPAQRAALDRLRLRERANRIGIIIAGAILVRWVAPLTREIWVYFVGFVLWGYAAYRFSSPPGVGPLIVQRSPGGEVTAGRRLRVTLLLQPWRSFPLDPLLIRLVARREEGKREEVAYETVHRLADGRSIAGGEALGAETTISIPEDVPPTSASPRVRWRLEVVAGSRVLRSIVVKVGEPTRPRRKR